MKRIISIMASLAILHASQLNANIKDIYTSNDSLITNPEKIATETKAATLKTISGIPNGKLDLSVNIESNSLEISLTGVANQNLEWIIYKPKGKVISRISTSSVINEILIDGLENGDYVLMIKDTQGRILYQPFTQLKNS